MPNELISILLVEDDEIECEAFTRALDQYQIDNPLVCVSDGVEALEALRGEGAQSRLSRPYIILTNINMPRMGGLELLRELRADSQLKQSVVFVLTSSQRDHDVMEAYNLQVAGYLSKSRLGLDFKEVIHLLNLYQASIYLPHQVI